MCGVLLWRGRQVESSLRNAADPDSWEPPPDYDDSHTLVLFCGVVTCSPTGEVTCALQVGETPMHLSSLYSELWLAQEDEELQTGKVIKFI